MRTTNLVLANCEAHCGAPSGTDFPLNEEWG